MHILGIIIAVATAIWWISRAARGARARPSQRSARDQMRRKENGSRRDAASELKGRFDEYML